MTPRPVRRQSLVDMSVDALVSIIAEGRLRPGDELPTLEELCRQLSVSRVSVREAVQRLVALGAIETGNGRRMTVGRSIDALDVAHVKGWEAATADGLAAEYVELRILLEPELAALAAVRMTPTQVEELGGILERMRGASEDEEHALNYEFHRALAAGARNGVSARFLAWLDEKQNPMHRNEHVGGEGAFQAGLYDSHYLIYLAVKERNPETARWLVRKHIEVGHGSIAADSERPGGVAAAPNQRAADSQS